MKLRSSILVNVCGIPTEHANSMILTERANHNTAKKTARVMGLFARALILFDVLDFCSSDHT